VNGKLKSTADDVPQRGMGLGRRERSWARLHWYDQWYPAANHSDLQQARQAVRRKRSQRLHLKGEPERCLDLVDTVRPLAGHSQRGVPVTDRPV